MTEPAFPTAQTAPRRLFLLSPANTSGRRLERLCDPAVTSPWAERVRSAEGLPIADAFCHVSSLYFRGKIAYARRFAVREEEILVIAPGFGLVAPSWPLDVERLQAMRQARVDVLDDAYAVPMREGCVALGADLPRDAEVVLLGSIASGKYLDLLAPAFGDRLRFPGAFVGAGELQRGALLLRAARDGEELRYVGLETPRSARPSTKAARAAGQGRPSGTMRNG